MSSPVGEFAQSAAYEALGRECPACGDRWRCQWELWGLDYDYVVECLACGAAWTREDEP